MAAVLALSIMMLLAAVADPTASLSPPNVIVVGGSSGMGKATALQVLEHGGRVLLISRSTDKLETARNELLRSSWLQEEEDDAGRGDRITVASVDITNEDEVERLAATDLIRNGDWNGLVVTAAGRAAHGPVESLPTKDARDMMESKLWGAYYSCKYFGANLKPFPEGTAAAIVLCAGILNRRPGLNCAPLAMANGALEGLTRTLALEWGPNIRVNCLSPGFCDTERFDHMDPTRKSQMIENTAASLPLQKVGQPQDMGQAVYYLLTAPFCTGIVLDVDGGHAIRQYANAQKDPMRQKQQGDTEET